MDLILAVCSFVLAAVPLVFAVALVARSMWPRHSVADEVQAWLERNSQAQRQE